MHTHSQVTDIVKENDAGRVCGIVWLAQQSAHDNVRAPRFVYYGSAKLVVLIAELMESIGNRSPVKTRATGDDDTSGLATGMRINDANTRELRRIR